mgnify:CR=1 FL=1
MVKVAARINLAVKTNASPVGFVASAAKYHWFGIGANRFKSEIGNYSRYSGKDAHNYYVLTLAETGWQGLLSLLWLVWAMWRLGGRLSRAAFDP